MTHVENIKPDRTSEDLLFQVLLDLGIDLTLPVQSKVIQDKTVFLVDHTVLMACFDNDISESLIKELATHTPIQIVFKDTGFTDDQTRINAHQIFKTISPGTEMKVI